MIIWWTWIIFILFVVGWVVYILLNKKGKENRALIILGLISVFLILIFILYFPAEKSKLSEQNYFLGIAEITGGILTIFGVLLTIKDQEKERKSSEANFDKKIKEQLRLEHLPILKFSCNNNCESRGNRVYRIDCNQEETKSVQLNINIKNVGLGSAQKIYFQTIIGIDNNNSKCGVENQIIEPKDSNDETFYFEIPKGLKNFYRSIRIIVFYSDLLDNNYVQVLVGNISVNYTEIDGVVEYIPNVTVRPDGEYKKIGKEYKYELPEDAINFELNRIKAEDKQKEIEERFSKDIIDKIDNIVGEYVKENKNLEYYFKNFFPKIELIGVCGGPEDYSKVKRNIYLVKSVEIIGINEKEDVKCETELIVNTKTEIVRTKSKKITYLNVKKINKIQKYLFNQYIRTNLKKIKKSEQNY